MAQEFSITPEFIFTLLESYMMKLLLSILFACTCIESFAYKPVYRFAYPQKGFIKILSASGKNFIVTRDQILQTGNGKIKNTVALSFACNDATVYNGDIAMATDSGIVLYSVTRNSFQAFLPKQWKKKTDCVITDALHKLWFSSLHEGAFLVNKDSVVGIQVQAPVVYCLASTPDTNVWVGTNIGLYRISAATMESRRYAEEGISAYAIPDNLVEKLYPDNEANVWAQLAETFVYISPQSSDEEVPAFDYIGNKENKVWAVAKPKGIKNGYLFATTTGMILVNPIKSLRQGHVGEIHTTFEENGFLLTHNTIRKPKEWKDLPVTNVFSEKKFTWFATERGVWCVSNKALTAALKKFAPRGS